VAEGERPGRGCGRPVVVVLAQGFLDQRHQGQAGEERAGAQLQDAKLQSPRCRRQGAGRWPLRCAVRLSLCSCTAAPIVSVSSASIGLGRSSPPERGHDHRHRRPSVVEDFEQCRQIQGHRGAPLYEFLGGITQRLTRWPVPRAQARRTGRELHHQRGHDRRPPLGPRARPARADQLPTPEGGRWRCAWPPWV
jgi:hypothetical protein